MNRPKLLLPWGDTSILGWQLRAWRQIGVRQIAVVCAAGDGAVIGELDRLGFSGINKIFNPAPQDGMFNSIRCAAQWGGWTGDLTHWSISLGDQPQLRLETRRAVIEWATMHPQRVCQPVRLGHFRHPVVMPKSVFAQLAASPAPNLKSFLAALPEPVTGCPVEDVGLDVDIDTPGDYEAALARFSPSATPATSASSANERSPR